MSFTSVLHALPRGGCLPPDVWQRRHSALSRVLLAHVPFVVIYGLARGYSVEHAALSAAPIAALWFATRTAERRVVAACLCAAGLITSSSMLVHLSGGLIEMHFHFFVMVALLTLYQDWLPFVTALVLIVLEHGLVGVLAPHAVYDHSSAWHNPWLWALVHGVFVLAASVAGLAAWAINERDHERVNEEIAALRQMREEQLRYQSRHDALTGLGNRRMLTDTLESLLEADAYERPVAMLFVDLDGFKLVNDLFGHDVGDLVLVEVSRRIAAAARPGDVVTRLGGDEFVVLCLGLVDETAAQLVARRIEHAVARPVVTNVGDVQVTASVGIACSRQWPYDAARLLHEADLAMYRAKQLGKNRCQIYDDELRAGVEDRGRREAFLRRALDEGLLELVYQPIFGATGGLVALEALLRIVGDDGELLAPAPYIEVAEETGLSMALTEWVVNQACRQVAEWRRDIAPSASVAINVSGRDVGQDHLGTAVFEALAAAGIAPEALTLELTETALVDAGQDKVAQLRSFCDAGIRVGIDDFGTGYASLQYLRALPVSFVKIDRSFISGMTTSGADRAIVAAIATLSRELDMTCIAEGVETPDQLAAVISLNVDLVQGYLLGRPVAASDVPELLRSAYRCAAADVPQQRGSGLRAVSS